MHKDIFKSIRNRFNIEYFMLLRKLFCILLYIGAQTKAVVNRKSGKRQLFFYKQLSDFYLKHIDEYRYISVKCRYPSIYPIGQNGKGRSLHDLDESYRAFKILTEEYKWIRGKEKG